MKSCDMGWMECAHLHESGWIGIYAVDQRPLFFFFFFFLFRGPATMAKRHIITSVMLNGMEMVE